MIYLGWTLLNFGLIFLFIVVCFRTTKLIREKLGVLAAVIFVIGLLSFVNNPSGNNTTGRRTPKLTFTNALEVEPGSFSIVSKPIETYVGSTTNLRVMFSKEKLTGKAMATEADIYILGLVGGHQWAPDAVSVTPSSNPGSFNYRVTGSLKWMLLGIPVFHQAKTLEGAISPL